MSRRIFYDGLKLSLEHGTGIATYKGCLPGSRARRNRVAALYERLG